jgi:signal transduction histidine kinase
LFRALQEALTNAVRYSGSPVVEVSIRAGGEEAFLTVKDYGCGIPMEVLRKFHEDGTGLGVGLSGMHERLHDLGGHLELTSDEHGTTVGVHVPLTPPQQKRARSTSAA